MNEEIDWSKAPGATHYNLSNALFYRFGEKAEVFLSSEWDNAAAPSPKHYAGDGWIVRPNLVDRALKADQREQTRSAIIELAWKQCGIQGDAIRQLATALAADGYRKFEIVDEEQ